MCPKPRNTTENVCALPRLPPTGLPVSQWSRHLDGPQSPSISRLPRLPHPVHQQNLPALASKYSPDLPPPSSTGSRTPPGIRQRLLPCLPPSVLSPDRPSSIVSREASRRGPYHSVSLNHTLARRLTALGTRPQSQRSSDIRLLPGLPFSPQTCQVCSSSGPCTCTPVFLKHGFGQTFTGWPFPVPRESVQESRPWRSTSRPAVRPSRALCPGTFHCIVAVTTDVTLSTQNGSKLQTGVKPAPLSTYPPLSKCRSLLSASSLR